MGGWLSKAGRAVGNFAVNPLTSFQGLTGNLGDKLSMEQLTGSPTSTETVNPWGPTTGYLERYLPRLEQEYFQNGQIRAPQFYPGQMVSGPSSEENFANSAAMGSYGSMNQRALRGYDASDAMLQGVGGTEQAGVINQNTRGVTNIAGQLGQGIGGTASGQMVDRSAQGMANLAGRLSQGIGGTAQARTIGQNTGGIIDTSRQLLQGVGTPGTTSVTPDYGRVREITSAIAQPTLDIFKEQVLPGISDTAQAGGAVGGSRQKLFEALAASRVGRDIGNIATQVAERERDRADNMTMNYLGANLASKQAGMQGLQNASNTALNYLGQDMASQQAGMQGMQGAGNMALNYLGQDMASKQAGMQGMQGASNTALNYLNTNLNTQQAGLQGMQGTANMQGNALSWLDTIGQRATGRNQARLDADRMRWNYNQAAPRQAMNEYQNMILNMANAGRSSTGANPNYMNPIQAAAGIGSTVAGMAGM